MGVHQKKCLTHLNLKQAQAWALLILLMLLKTPNLPAELRYFELEIKSPPPAAMSNENSQSSYSPNREPSSEGSPEDSPKDAVTYGVPPGVPTESSAERNAPGSPKTRRVISSLDPSQYSEYHPLKPGETLTMIRSWRCSGRTGSRKPCSGPTPKTREAKETSVIQVEPSQP